MPKVQPNAHSGANTPHNGTPAQAISHRRRTTVHPRHDLSSPDQPQRHPTLPKVHNNAPRQQISLLPTPQHRPIPIGGTQMCTLGGDHIHQHHPNSTQPTSKAHSSAPSTPAVLPPGQDNHLPPRRTTAQYRIHRTSAPHRSAPHPAPHRSGTLKPGTLASWHEKGRPTVRCAQ